MSRRLFVDNFDPKTTKENLEGLFRQSGLVESVAIPPQVTLKEAITHAFVVMETEDAASMAIKSINNKVWNGHRLTVTTAGPIARVSNGFGGGVPRRISKDGKLQ